MAEEKKWYETAGDVASAFIPGLNALTGLFGGGGGDEEQQDPTSYLNIVRLLPPGAQEQLLRDLGVKSAEEAFRVAQGGGYGGLTDEDIAYGRISPEMQRRIDQMTTQNYDELIGRAASGARSRASLQGMAGSSQEGEQFAQLAAPLISERANMRTNLYLGELQRQRDLRSRLLEDLAMAQNSPILQQLFQERLAQPTTQHYASTDPGEVRDWAESIGAGGTPGKSGREQRLEDMRKMMAEHDFSLPSFKGPGW